MVYVITQDQSGVADAKMVDKYIELLETVISAGCTAVFREKAAGSISGLDSV